MPLSEITRITKNRTLMIFIGSAIVGIIAAIYGAVSDSVTSSQERQILLSDSKFLKSELSEVKAQVAEELSKPDNLTLINPGNVTFVLPNNSNGNIFQQGYRVYSDVGFSKIVINK